MMNNNKKINWIYMTAGSRQEADKIGRTLLEEKLAACINIIERMNSMYV